MCARYAYMYVCIYFNMDNCLTVILIHLLIYFHYRFALGLFEGKPLISQQRRRIQNNRLMYIGFYWVP